MSQLFGHVSMQGSTPAKYALLSDIAQISTGSRPTDGQLAEGGECLYWNGGSTPSGYVAMPNTPAETVTIPSRGSVGIVGYSREPFWCGQLCYRVRTTSAEIEQRFLYFALKEMEPALVRLQQTGSIPALNKKELGSVRIPVPRQEVQREIVRILDTFTELEAELQAELQARRRQYGHYANSVLSPSRDTPRQKIGDLSSLSSGRNKSRSPGGIYPVYGSTGRIGSTDSAGYSGDALLIARVGANAGQVNAVGGDYDVSDNTLVVRPSPEWDLRFGLHQMIHMNLNQYAVGGGQPLVTGGLLRSLEVQVPPLAEQRRIASKLDTLGALMNDVTAGLPAELAARRKQYEYYRDKLLTFKEVKQ